MFAFLRALEHTLLDITHRREDALKILVRRQHLEALLVGDFDVHAQTVGVEAGLVHQSLACPRDALQMDISVEMMHRPEVFGHTDHPLHRIIRITHDARREEQTLDVVPAIKLDG